MSKFGLSNISKSLLSLLLPLQKTNKHEQKHLLEVDVHLAVKEA